MKIGIKFWNTKNYGDEMMVASFVRNYRIVNKSKKEPEFHLISNLKLKREDYIRVPKFIPTKFQYIQVSILSDHNANLLQKAMALISYPLRFSLTVLRNKYDAMLVSGGDVLSEYYGLLGLTLELMTIWLTSIITPTFILGSSIGPFKSWRVFLAKTALSKSKIYARDMLTYKYLIEQLNLSSVKKSADLAFLDIPNQDKEKDVLVNFELDKDRYITIVPSGLWMKYTDNYETYINTWAKIIQGIQEKIPHIKIVLLAHVLHSPSVSDASIINQICEKLESADSNRIKKIERPILPHEARIILGNGIFTITGRMHAAISTFQMGKPAISLSYSIKYDGIIGKELGFPELVIKADTPKLWQSGEIVNLVLDKVDYVMGRYHILKRKIQKHVEIQKKKALIQIEDIARILDELQ